MSTINPEWCVNTLKFACGLSPRMI